MICLGFGELGCCKNKGDCEGGGYGCWSSVITREFRSESDAAVGCFFFTKGTGFWHNPVGFDSKTIWFADDGGLKIGVGACGITTARGGCCCWEFEFADTKFKGKFGDIVDILILFGSGGCKMIDESSKLDDPIEDPIDEFEHVLRKFDGGIGTLKGSVKETDKE